MLYIQFKLLKSGDKYPTGISLFSVHHYKLVVIISSAHNPKFTKKLIIIRTLDYRAVLHY